MFQIKRLQDSRQETESAAALEKSVFSDAWSSQAITDTLNQNQAVIFAAWNKEELIGYIILYYVLDECEIVRIAVTPSYRCQGAAKALLLTAEKFCLENEIQKIFLDVRESNTPARTLYQKHGFQIDGIRKNFYTNPSENAILMSHRLNNSP